MPSPRSALPVAVLLVLAGCVGGPPPSDPHARGVVNESVDALRDVDSYRYTIDAHARVTADDQRETLDVEGFGAVNATQQRLRTTVRGGDENETAFLDGRTVYASCPYSRYVNVEDAWYPAASLPENRSWRAVSDLAVGRFLQEVPVYDGGNATLDGRRTHVVVARPSAEQFRDLESRLTVGAGENLNRGRIENVTVRLWVDAETHRPQRLQYVQRRSVEGATLDVRQTIRFVYRPASVSLPNTVDSEDACPRPS